METKVKAILGSELYYTEISAGNNTLITDEPISLGGGDKGFNPMELLASSLASCTAATLRMYADRKQWDLGNIHVEVEMNQDNQQNITSFTREVSFDNKELTEEQLTRLNTIANKCPIHKILVGQIEVNTILK